MHLRNLSSSQIHETRWRTSQALTGMISKYRHRPNPHQNMKLRIYSHLPLRMRFNQNLPRTEKLPGENGEAGSRNIGTERLNRKVTHQLLRSKGFALPRMKEICSHRLISVAPSLQPLSRKERNQ